MTSTSQGYTIFPGRRANKNSNVTSMINLMPWSIVVLKFGLNLFLFNHCYYVLLLFMIYDLKQFNNKGNKLIRMNKNRQLREVSLRGAGLKTVHWYSINECIHRFMTESHYTRYTCTYGPQVEDLIRLFSYCAKVSLCQKQPSSFGLKIEQLMGEMKSSSSLMYRAAP